MKTILLFLALTTFAPAQTWQKITVEGGNQASSPVVTLPAGTQYRFGVGTGWCDAVTVTVATEQTVWWSSFTCTQLGKPVADPDPNVQKELDVAETAVAQSISYTQGGKTTVVTVPALPIPPITFTCPGTAKGTLTGTVISNLTFNQTGNCTTQ